METVQRHRQPAPRHAPADHTYSSTGQSPVALGRGDEMGRFNMGSTVILIYGPGQMTWTDPLRPGQSIRTGQAIGHWLADPPAPGC
ncbi:MAG: phosphatidylserine decarboxylase [Pseudomonadota bacterium]